MYLTMIHDITGLPRAWGRARNEEDAKRIAEAQWRERVAKRAAEGTTDISECRGETTTTKEA